jgi:hypothetical protein
MSRNTQQPLHAPVSAIAKRWGTSVQYVYGAIARGDVKAIRLPGTGRKPVIRVCLASVEALENKS